jgi:hypothetical protein
VSQGSGDDHARAAAVASVAEAAERGCGPNDLLAAALQRLPTRIADSIDAFIRRKTVGDLAPYGL